MRGISVTMLWSVCLVVFAAACSGEKSDQSSDQDAVQVVDVTAGLDDVNDVVAADSLATQDITALDASPPSDAQSQDVITDLDASKDGTQTDVDVSTDSLAAVDAVDGQDGAINDSSVSQDAADLDAVSSDTALVDTSSVDTAPIDTVAIDTAPPQATQQDPLSLAPAKFNDVTLSYGIDPKASHAYCAGVGDFDGDGDDDLVFVEIGALTNKGQIHAVLLGSSQPIHVKSPLQTWNLVPDLGCTVIDQDGDGKADLWLGGSSGAAIYLSEGAGKFKEASAQILPPLFNVKASSFAPVDLNGDGALDLVVGAGSHPDSCKNTSCIYMGAEFQCQVSPTPALSSTSQDRVLIRSATGALVDETAKWNLPVEGGYASYVSAWDIDLDGDQDLLIGTDFHTPWILQRQGNGFVANGSKAGLHGYAHAMGWGVADFNGDGTLDLFLADLGPSALYKQNVSKNGALSFQDVSYQSSLAALTLGTSDWTPVVADFDQDGWEDMLVGVSMAAQKATFLKMLDGCSSQNAPLKALDLLLINDQGKGWSASRTAVTDCGEVSAVAQAVVDLDADGDLDVIQVRPGCVFPYGVVRVLRNDLVKKGGSFTIRLKGKGSNTAAVGARVVATIDGKVRQRQIVATAGLGGGGALWAHFGLGAAIFATDVKVYWPGGGQTLVGKVSSGQNKVIKEP
ncbi:MAG TPA: hypothetical protein DCQ06_03405 [Myxococcales bacterium]|nr:hypothetical protein [Myxococcales bacterium]HAN30623.1 hypothetical protein [Myxococcales bacterium]